MRMKRFIVMIAVVSLTLTAMAQGAVSGAKHSVATNSFWANWFVQADVAGTSFWGSQEDRAVSFGQLLKGYRTNVGFSVALGKWFTPGIGLRTKFNGLWGRTVVSDDKSTNASRYWTLHEQVLFNLSNMLLGYNERRLWNFIPYVGGGLGHSLTYNTDALGLSFGLLNTLRISRKLAVNIDLSYGLYGAAFDGNESHGDERRLFRNRDRALNMEVGLTYRLGRSSWNKTPDMDALNALTQSELDALNAQLEDALAENDRLMQELEAKTPAPAVTPAPEPVVVTAPVSVFFAIGRAVIDSERDLQDVAALVDVAKRQNAKLVVTGYADSLTGSADHNLQLSRQRADAVVAELLKMGVAADRVEVVAAGGVDTLSPAPYNRRATVQLK